MLFLMDKGPSHKQMKTMTQEVMYLCVFGNVLVAFLCKHNILKEILHGKNDYKQ